MLAPLPLSARTLRISRYMLTHACHGRSSPLAVSGELCRHRNRSEVSVSGRVGIPYACTRRPSRLEAAGGYRAAHDVAPLRRPSRAGED